MLSFTDRQRLVQHCTNSAAPAFYRDLYGLTASASPLTIATEHEWSSLPILEKAALSAVPMHERSFLPLSQLDHVRASSGTSGKPPLFSPRTHVRHMEYRLQYHDFKNAFLAFGVPLMPHWHELMQEELGIVPRVIALDPEHPAFSVHLAAAAGADAASLFAYQLRPVGEAMKAIGLNERMRFVELAGEMCTRARYEYMRATFPNAVLLHSYGSSEVEDVHMGMPCRPMTGEEPYALFHPKKTHFLELIHPVTHEPIEPVAGAEGDLLITAYPGEPAAFPLIRFRIGDTVRIIDTACGHGTWSFTVLGRTELDFLKIERGMLRVDELQRVLRMFDGTVTDEFELHRYEHLDAGRTKAQVVLHLDIQRPVDFDELAATIAKHLRVNPEYTYADGVRDGHYLPLVCTRLEKADRAKKHTFMFAHNS